MICKNCNGEIRPSDERCPRCGIVVQWEGGNGFWDMAGELRPEPKAAPATVAEKPMAQPKLPEIVVPKPPTDVRKKKNTGLFTPVLLILSALLLLLLFGKNARLRDAEREIDTLKERIEQLSKQPKIKPSLSKPKESTAPTKAPKEEGVLSQAGQRKKADFEAGEKSSPSPTPAEPTSEAGEKSSPSQTPAEPTSTASPSAEPDKNGTGAQNG